MLVQVCEVPAIRLLFAEGELGGLHACGDTFPYIVPLPNIFLSRLFSKRRLKRKDFQEVARLPWAQQVPNSNCPELKSRRPDQDISHVFFNLLKALFTPNSPVELCQTGGLNSQVI